MRPLTRRQAAAEIIAEATRDLPATMSLRLRARIVQEARPWWFRGPWSRSAWAAAGRIYLIRFGYRPRLRLGAQLPLFPEDATAPLFPPPPRGRSVEGSS